MTPIGSTGPILLVEDNADDEKLAIRALRKNNIANELVVARDGQEALDLLVGERAREFALVLLDLRLPKLHGLEVLKAVRADPRTALLPVVILTSSQEESDIVAGYALRANSYVRKPVDFHEFVEAVRSLGFYWLILNQPPPPQRPG